MNARLSNVLVVTAVQRIAGRYAYSG